ncbi:hypothetical protein ACGFSB_07650 [Streptomyces sp. NPDC048441]|uniref:hypothetical protein n=1 Tax=Streptomyces sp. NPDC048441 TaxID=3365552 RepID=UPI0037224918
MADIPPEFSVATDDAANVDRAAVLLESARRIDTLSGHLGEPRTPDDSEYGNLLRALAEDTAEFAAFPDVYPVPVEALPKVEAETASRIAALEENYSFWWTEFPINLFPRRNWGFHRLEVRLEFNPDTPADYRRPKAYDILPHRRFDQLLKVEGTIGLRLGGDLRFGADAGPLDAAVGPVSVTAGAGADAGFGARASVAAGPFSYSSSAARIDHSATGAEKVFWRLDGKEFFQADAPKLIVILQVPRKTREETPDAQVPQVARVARETRVRAVLQAYRHFTYFPAGLQSLIRELPRALQVFFRNGSPIGDRREYVLFPDATEGG